MMDERSSRIFIGMCLLVLVWIGVYWMWEPTRDQKPPEISFAQPEEARPQPAAQPTNQPTAQPQSPPRTSPDPFTSTPDPSPDTQTEPTPRRVLVEPEFTEHIVRENDTMQSIALQYFGSGGKWGIIARANPFVDPEKLRPGMPIRIPKDPDNIQGRITGNTTPEGVVESHTDPASRVIEYVVRPGDSLSRIAQRIYGSARHARFIYDNNRDILKSMDDISVGQLLKLPPIPEDESGTP